MKQLDFGHTREPGFERQVLNNKSQYKKYGCKNQLLYCKFLLFFTAFVAVRMTVLMTATAAAATVRMFMVVMAVFMSVTFAVVVIVMMLMVMFVFVFIVAMTLFVLMMMMFVFVYIFTHKITSNFVMLNEFQHLFILDPFPFAA